MPPTLLNERAFRLAEQLMDHATDYRVEVREIDGARLIDCGAKALGGLQAGLQVAHICVAGLADIRLAPGPWAGLPGPVIQVFSDDPIRACMACQYAGWQVQVDKYFAMASGPMRAVYGGEAIYAEISGKEEAPLAVGVLETRHPPTSEVLSYLAEKLKLPPRAMTLAYAPAASLAGSIQVVARSLETALHKLHTLRFDLRKVISGHGVAPFPPVAEDELEAIGWTNDAILYGGQVSLWLHASDDELRHLGPQIPSSSSKDHGAPFAELFARYGNFYAIDPLLFSPAEIILHNLSSGQTHHFGRIEPEILRRSFHR